MDQATVLEESVKYIKYLQEKEKTLEGQSSQITTDPGTGSCSNDENFTNEPQPLPQIEAKLSGRNVLIRILCVNCKGVQVKVLKEIEKLNLGVVSSNAIPFGTSLAISVVAQVKFYTGCVIN